MMYYPDEWSIIKVTTETETNWRILSCWYGNFSRGNSWKLSSAIEDVVQKKLNCLIMTASGSEYSLEYKNERMGLFLSSVLSSLKEQAEGVELEAVDFAKYKEVV